MKESVPLVIWTRSDAVRTVTTVHHPETIASFRVDVPLLDPWVVGSGLAIPSSDFAVWNGLGRTVIRALLTVFTETDNCFTEASIWSFRQKRHICEDLGYANTRAVFLCD